MTGYWREIVLQIIIICNTQHSPVLLESTMRITLGRVYSQDAKLRATFKDNLDEADITNVE